MEEVLRNWVPLLLSIIALGTAGWGILQGPARKNAEAIKALAETLGKLIDRLDARQDATEKDVASLKATVDQLPDRGSIHRLELVVKEMAGDMKAMNESLKAVREISVMTRDMVSRDNA